MIVLDSSALVEVLLLTEIGARISDQLEGAGAFHAPGLIDPEVASVLRRVVHQGKVESRRAEQAIHSLAEFPVFRWEHTQLLPRAWSLRGNLTAYDAMYVALAELLDVELFTLDRGIQRSVAHGARIRHLG